jgi:hypothetical protein
MVGALGAWTSLEYHQPRVWDDLLGPLPFCQSDNNCRSDDEGSRSFVGNILYIYIYIHTLHVGHMGDLGLKGRFGWWKLTMKLLTCQIN